MKKFFITLCALIMCVPTIALVGCDKKDDHAINMTRYFEENVDYQLYTNYSPDETLKLSYFLDDENDHMDQYSQITFNGIRDWVYRLNVETITFMIYSNKTMDVQFNLRITNLANGSPSATSPTNTYNEPFTVSLVEGTKVPVTIAINDYFQSYTSSTSIRISPQDRSYFVDTDPVTNQQVDNDFKYDILNFQIHGYHKAKN